MFEKLVTHSGQFHADDVFAAATLRKLAPMALLIRTRDPDVLAEVVADQSVAVFDVGDHFEPERFNFDHHQRGFERAREDSGIPYAAFGLVWETFGADYCRELFDGEAPEDNDMLAEVVARIEQQLVMAIDAADCGVLTLNANLKDAPEVEIEPTSLSHLVALYNPTGRQPAHVYDAAFERVLDMATVALEAQAFAALADVRARRVVEKLDDGSPILVLEEYVPWHEHIGEHHRFVLSPALDGSGWMVETVQDDFVPRCPLPSRWGGVRNEELAKLSGVEDAIFCHRALFIAAAKSRAGALKMANLALEAQESLATSA